MPLAIVVDDIPVALATAAKPPRQRFRACPTPTTSLVQLARRRPKGDEGQKTWTGWGVLAYNLDTLTIPTA